MSLDAAAAGCGTWATHFIAMLAYDPGIGAGYNLVVTILSLLISRVGYRRGPGRSPTPFCALDRGPRRRGGRQRDCGDALHRNDGAGGARPHYLVPNLVVASVLLGIAFGALAVF